MGRRRGGLTTIKWMAGAILVLQVVGLLQRANAVTDPKRPALEKGAIFRGKLCQHPAWALIATLFGVSVCTFWFGHVIAGFMLTFEGHDFKDMSADDQIMALKHSGIALLFAIPLLLGVVISARIIKVLGERWFP